MSVFLNFLEQIVGRLTKTLYICNENKKIQTFLLQEYAKVNVYTKKINKIYRAAYLQEVKVIYIINIRYKKLCYEQIEI